MDARENSVGTEALVDRTPDFGLSIICSTAKMQSSDTEATIYYGCMRDQDSKVGEFVARIDRQNQILFVEELFIQQRYRGKGLGKKALDFLEAKASSLNVREIVLEPCPVDSGAFTAESLRNWYMEHGYVCRRRNIFARSTHLLAKVIR